MAPSMVDSTVVETVVSEESSVSVGDVSLTIPVFEPVCEAAVDAEFRRCAF